MKSYDHFNVEFVRPPQFTCEDEYSLWAGQCDYSTILVRLADAILYAKSRTHAGRLCCCHRPYSWMNLVAALEKWDADQRSVVIEIVNTALY